MTVLSPDPKSTRLAKPMKWAFIAFNVVMLCVAGSSAYEIFASPATGNLNASPHLAYVPLIMTGFVWFIGAVFLGLGVGLATGKLKLKESDGSDRDYGGDWDGPSD